MNRQRARWVKAHLCVGTKTQTVTAVFMDEKNSGDCPQFDPLTKATAENFIIEEMSADKAYLGNDNLELIVGMWGTPFIPFKSNSLPGESEVWRRMFHYFAYRRDEFLTHYHRRSLVESAFSMINTFYTAFSLEIVLILFKLLHILCYIILMIGKGL